MITALSFHGLVFPPHCSARTTQVTAAATSVAPTKSILTVWRSKSLIDRLLRSAPRGGDDLRRVVTAMRDTPPTGRLMKKHHRFPSPVSASCYLV